MSDDPSYPQDTHATQEPRVLPLPKATITSLLLDRMDDTSLEVAHLSNKLDAFSSYLVGTVTSSQWLIKVIAVALALNMLLLIGLLVLVSFLYGALR